MRDVVQNAPTWTVGAGISGMFSAVNDLSLLGLLSAIGICIGIGASLYNWNCRRIEHKAFMKKIRKEEQDSEL